MRKNKCVNPKIGEHPDLFERDIAGRPKMTAVWSGPPVVGGQYVEGMSREQVRALPRDAFNEADWDSLDADDQEYILENDPESLARVKALVDAFVEREKYLTEPDESTKEQWINDDSEYFSQWLGEQDEMVDYRSIREEVVELVEKLGGPEVSTMAEETIRGAINEALRDPDNYNYSISGDDYHSEGIFKTRTSGGGGGIYFDKRDLAELTDPMFPDEIKEAVKQINHDTYIHVRYEDMFPKYELQIEYETDFYFVADVDWDKVEAAARETLGQEEIEESQGPPESRIVYRFKDGFYVQDLLSSELKAESAALNHCVGNRSMGYYDAVRRGDTKIFSLRRPSGKPLFTIEAAMGDDGSGGGHGVANIRQIRGKSDRLPGWDLHKEGQGGYKAMKVEEVKKAVEFIHYLLPNRHPFEISTMAPAMQAVEDELQEGRPVDKELAFFFTGTWPKKKNPRRRLPPNDRPLGFNSPWTP